MLTFICTTLLLVAVSMLALAVYIVIRQKYFIKQLQEKVQRITESYEQLASEAEQVSQSVDRSDYMDHVTGMPDRRIFEDRLQYHLKLNSRLENKSTFAILSLDIDNFSKVDQLGRDVGDRLLRELAVRLRSSVRQVDTATHFAGGCFLLLLPHLIRPETAIYVAQRIQDNLLKPFTIEQYELIITVSIGIAVYPTDGNDARTLLQNAEAALREVKNSGKNKYRFYQNELQNLGERELSIAKIIRSNEFLQNIEIKYKPFLNVDSNKIVYVQVTPHLRHPEFGLVPLADILNIVENSGKIIEMNEWVVRVSMQQIQQWGDNGTTPKHVGVQVSLSHLDNPRLIFVLSEVMKQHNNNISLILEINDDSIQQSSAAIEKIFIMLSEMNIGVAVGVIALGHFAIQKINRIPLNYLKIDSKITDAIMSQPSKVEILKKIIDLAVDEKITVMAEGVEDEKQKECLKQLGCHMMAGKMFGFVTAQGVKLEGLPS